MMRFAIVICLMSLTGALAADQMESKHARQDVGPDLDPTSSFWRGVPVVVVDRDTSGNQVAGHRTEVRSRWTSHNLYFLYVCPYEHLNLKPDPKTTVETNELWKWDVAEAFIGSDYKNIRRYKEFEISPQGEWVDLDIDLDSPHHEDGWTWNSGMQAAARIDKDAKIWYGFMRIPYASIDSRPAAAGNTLRINLFRSQGAKPDHKSIVWQPTHRPSFHTPEVFGEIKLVN
ncbi:MAG TPA: carbohydrate-binding family 9-like protein [Bryobacteraceae bacterium]